MTRRTARVLDPLPCKGIERYGARRGHRPRVAGQEPSQEHLADAAGGLHVKRPRSRGTRAAWDSIEPTRQRCDTQEVQPPLGTTSGNQRIRTR